MDTVIEILYVIIFVLIGLGITFIYFLNKHSKR